LILSKNGGDFKSNHKIAFKEGVLKIDQALIRFAKMVYTNEPDIRARH
jgi:hypothetical protein